jgi:hypothetical protein
MVIRDDGEQANRTSSDGRARATLVGEESPPAADADAAESPLSSLAESMDVNSTWLLAAGGVLLAVAIYTRY